jgi:hypothetical protein
MRNRRRKAGFDRYLRSQLFCCDEVSEQREPDTSPFDAHQFVK